MSRFIDAEKIDFSPLKDDFDRARANVIIMGQPTADVVEVKHGEWIVPSGEIKIFEDRYVICSKCNVMLPVVRELDRYWFCPNCGAKMDVPDTNVGEKEGADKLKVTCLNCKHLMFSDCYGECSKQLRIVKPNDTCKYAEPKERGAKSEQL